MKRITLLAGGAVATAIVLAVGAVTVANALGVPSDSSRVLDDHGVDTATVSPAPTPSGTRSAEPGDDHGHDGVVTVPPVGPTEIDRHGDPSAPDDDPGAHDQGGDNGRHTGADDGNGVGHGNGAGQGNSNGNGQGKGDGSGQGHGHDDGQGHR
jgi:hypothetical protein